MAFENYSKSIKLTSVFFLKIGHFLLEKKELYENVHILQTNCKQTAAHQERITRPTAKMMQITEPTIIPANSDVE